MSEGPAEGQCPHIKAKTPLTGGHAVPKVGLELHSNPCRRWTPPETYAIRPDPTDVRPDPKPKLWTLMLLLVSMVVEPPRRAGYRAGHPGLKGLRSLRDGPAALDPGTSAAPVGHAGAGAVRAAPVVACRWANARAYP
jgi:hypothetical protein